MNRLVKNRRFRQWVRASFGQNVSIRAILYNYAMLVYEFLTIEEEEKYRLHLSDREQIKLEYLGQFFTYAERYGYIDDHPVFNDVMVLNLQKVLSDHRLKPVDRVQIIYATGSLPYMVQVLEEMVDEVL